MPSSDKYSNLFLISKLNPNCTISTSLILSRVLCVTGSYSLILSIILSKNSILTGSSLLTGYISIISPLLLQEPSFEVVLFFS